MTLFVNALRWVARLTGVIALALGSILWSGSYSYLRFHIISGFLITVTLLLIGVLGFVARLKPALPTVAIAWAILLPYVGFAQLKLLPGSGHIVIQVIHLLIGIGAIGLAEVVGARIIRNRPT